MDKPISVGDLVQVVKTAYCGCGTYLGWTFIVAQVRTVSIGDPRACACGAAGLTQNPYDVADGHPKQFGFSVRVLKRIPPLGELEGAKTEEKLREPA